MKTSFRALASIAVLGLASATTSAQEKSTLSFARHAGASAVIGCATEYYTHSRAWAYGLTFAAGALY